ARRNHAGASRDGNETGAAQGSETDPRRSRNRPSLHDCYCSAARSATFSPAPTGPTAPTAQRTASHGKSSALDRDDRHPDSRDRVCAPLLQPIAKTSGKVVGANPEKPNLKSGIHHS